MSETDAFTETEYAALLDLAATKYRFINVADSAAHDVPVVVWRHDADHSIHRALALAEIEHARGVRAVYHLMTTSRYYNVLEPEVTRIIRRLAALGHYLGLHFDMDVFGEEGSVGLAEVAARVAFERNVIETAAGVSLTSMSFHNHLVNAERLGEEPRIAELANASAQSYFRSFRYVSDSNGMWRRGRLRDILEADPVERLLVLTHPEWWTPEPMTPFERMRRCVAGRADANLELYVYQLSRDGRLAPIADRSGLPPALVARVRDRNGKP